jgi:uncharacterized glyoxalase superfamily protein PhnB
LPNRIIRPGKFLDAPGVAYPSLGITGHDDVLRGNNASMATTAIFAYLHVDDVDALRAEFLQRGAIIRQPPTDRPWGMREMAIATLTAID